MPHESTDTLVLREDDGDLVTLRLNRPSQFNALSTDMLAALQAEFDTIAQQPDVRCVVLAAQGKAFCAGHDLREMQATRRLDHYQALFAQCSRVMQSIQSLPVRVIARVHGAATAADWGVVARAVADAALDDAVAQLARGIVEKSPTAVRNGKAMFYRQRQ